MGKMLATRRKRLVDLLEISDLLLREGNINLRILGSSMYPALRQGDTIRVEPTSIQGLRIGDIALFHRGGQLICHRIVKKHQTNGKVFIVTKGEIGSCRDEPVPAEDILGKVVEVKKGGIAIFLKYTILWKLKQMINGFLYRLGLQVSRGKIQCKKS